MSYTIIGGASLDKSRKRSYGIPRGRKLSVTEFNDNLEVKQLSNIVHSYLNDNFLPGVGILGIKENKDEYLSNPAESLRDEYGSLSTLAARRLAINDAPEDIKQAYKRLVDIWENQTEIRGFGEGLTAVKDYAIDIATAPESFISLGAIAGKTAASTAIRAAGVGGAWSGTDDFIRQSRDVEINRLDEISTPQVLATTALGAAFGGGLGFGGHKLSSFIQKRADLKALNKIEAEALERKTDATDATPIGVSNFVTDPTDQIPMSTIDDIRDAHLKSSRELKIRDQLRGVQRPAGFKRIDPDALDLDESDIRNFNRTPPETPTPIKRGNYKKKRKKGTGFVGAFHDKENNIIYVDDKYIKSQFDKAPWTKPAVKGVDPLPPSFSENYIRSPEEWVKFNEIHEQSHTQFKRLKGETTADYENRINNIAMAEIADPKIFVPRLANELEAFNKQYGGMGLKSDEELKDIVEGTFIELEGQSNEKVSNALFHKLHRWGTRYGSQFIFKPSTIFDPFAEKSNLAESLQRKLRFDTQRGFISPRKFDDQDFSEVFRETLGNNYVTYKVALDPIQSSISGKLEEGTNNLIVAAVRGTLGPETPTTINTAAKKIRDLLSFIGDELVENGVISRKTGPNYFPRNWNREAIENKRPLFKRLLLESGEAADEVEAENIVVNMLDKKNQLDQGGSGGATFFYNRVFDKIDDNKFADFLDSDMNSVMINYLAQSAKAIAKRKVLGVSSIDEFRDFYIKGIDTQMRKAGKALTLRDKKAMEQAYNHATGENLSRVEGLGGFALDLYGTVNRLAYLPLATVSSLTEIGINIAKAGPKASLKGFVSALKDARGTTQDKTLETLLNLPLIGKDGKRTGLTEREAWRELQEFGMDLDPLLLDTVERLSGSVIRNQTLQKVNNTFFRVTLLDQWTKFVQLASYKTGKNLIADNLNEINKLKTVDDSLRITRMKDQLNELGVDLNQGLEWIENGASVKDAFYKNVKRGAARYTNEVILMPTGESGLKPFFTSHPKTAILTQFLGYPIAFTNVVLKNAAKDLIKNPQQNAPKIFAAGLMMTEMARWTNWARSRGKSEENKSDQEIYEDAFVRWGGNGIVADMMRKAHEAAKVYQDPVAGVPVFLGPVGNDLYKIFKRGDLVRIFGEKIPGYGALGAIAPETKENYTEWLKEESRDFRRGAINVLGLKQEVEPIRFTRSEGGPIPTGPSVDNVSNVTQEPQERINPYTGEPYDVTAGPFNQDLIDRNNPEDPLRRLGFPVGGLLAKKAAPKVRDLLSEWFSLRHSMPDSEKLFRSEKSGTPPMTKEDNLIFDKMVKRTPERVDGQEIETQSVESYVEPSTVKTPLYKTTDIDLDTEYDMGFVQFKEIGVRAGTSEQAHIIAEKHAKYPGTERAVDYDAPVSITKGHADIRNPLVIEHDMVFKRGFGEKLDEDHSRWSAVNVWKDPTIKNTIIYDFIASMNNDKKLFQILSPDITDPDVKPGVLEQRIAELAGDKQNKNPRHVEIIREEFTTFQDRVDNFLKTKEALKSSLRSGAIRNEVDLNFKLEFHEADLNFEFGEMLNRLGFDSIKYRNQVETSRIKDFTGKGISPKDLYSYILLKPNQFKNVFGEGKEISVPLKESALPEKEVNQIVSAKRKVKEVPEEVKKKDFDMLPEDITKGDVLIVGENFNKQNVKVRAKLFKLIREELGSKAAEGEDRIIDLDKPTFLTDLLKETNKTADELFPEYGILGSISRKERVPPGNNPWKRFRTTEYRTKKNEGSLLSKRSQFNQGGVNSLMEWVADVFYDVDRKDLRANEREAARIVNKAVDKGLIPERERVTVNRQGSITDSKSLGEAFNAVNHIWLATQYPQHKIPLQLKEAFQVPQGLASSVTDAANNHIGFKIAETAKTNKEKEEAIYQAIKDGDVVFTTEQAKEVYDEALGRES